MFLIGKYERKKEGRKGMFYLTTHSTHFIYGYMVLDIWLRTILIVRKETRCRHIGYSLRLTTRVILYAPSHRQDITYHGICYTSRGALVETRNSSMGSPHEGSKEKRIHYRLIIITPNHRTLQLHIASCSSVVRVSGHCVILHGGPIVLFFIPASAPRLV